jgi:hypothetical protein
MDKDTKLALYLIIFPVVWTLIVAVFLWYFVSSLEVGVWMLSSVVLLLFGLPLVISLVIGERIMENKRVLSFILSPILTEFISLVFYFVFFRSFLYSEWFLHACCGPGCDFGNGEVFLILGVGILGFIAAIACLVSLFFIYSAHKSELKS